MRIGRAWLRLLNAHRFVRSVRASQQPDGCCDSGGDQDPGVTARDFEQQSQDSKDDEDFCNGSWPHMWLRRLGCRPPFRLRRWRTGGCDWAASGVETCGGISITRLRPLGGGKWSDHCGRMAGTDDRAAPDTAGPFRACRWIKIIHVTAPPVSRTNAVMRIVRKRAARNACSLLALLTRRSISALSRAISVALLSSRLRPEDFWSSSHAKSRTASVMRRISGAGFMRHASFRCRP